jgi:hypothetical protein
MSALITLSTLKNSIVSQKIPQIQLNNAIFFIYSLFIFINTCYMKNVYYFY